MPITPARPRLVIIALLGGAAAVTAAARDDDRRSAEQSAQLLIDAALVRLGGAEYLRAQRTWFVSGTGVEDLSAELQGTAPDEASVRPHAEWLGVDAEAGAVAWERRTPRNDESLRWRRLVYKPDSTGFVVWTDSVAVMNARATDASRRRALMRRIPHLLLLEAARAESTSLGATRTVDGQRQREVRARLDGAWLSLWISSDSSLLGAAEYRTVLPGRGDVTVRWEWRNWHGSPGTLWRPAGHRVVIDGRTYQDVAYQRFEAATPAAESLLTIPNEVRTRPRPMAMNNAAAGDDVLPARGEVAPGVHIEEVGGFNTLIVEFADFVLLVEAPSAHPGFEAIPATRAADRIAADLAARIRAIARGRPLGFTVLTHHHSDHIGAVPALAGLTRTFLVPPDSRGLVQSAVTTAGARATVESVVGARTISDSTRSLVIYDVGSNPHTRHNLFVWLPRERIGFQGDLFYYDAGAAGVPSDRLAISAFFARWLASHSLAPRGVYGVHSRGATGPRILDGARAR